MPGLTCTHSHARAHTHTGSILDLEHRSSWSVGVDFSVDGKDQWFTETDRPVLERLFSNLRTIGHAEAMAMVAYDTDCSFTGSGHVPGQSSFVEPGYLSATDESEKHFALARALAVHYHVFLQQRRE